jgi:hypothetical protein
MIVHMSARRLVGLGWRFADHERAFDTGTR